MWARLCSWLCVHTVQLSLSRYYFTLMASLVRPFLWKPGCQGNTACLLELEMAFSIPDAPLFLTSWLHSFILFYFLFLGLLVCWFLCCWQSESLVLLTAMYGTHEETVRKRWVGLHSKQANKQTGIQGWTYSFWWMRERTTFRNQGGLMNGIQEIMMKRSGKIERGEGCRDKDGER